MKVNKCVICKEHFTGIGNNPVPLKTSGVCCDFCNTTKVIPARINFYGIKPSIRQGGSMAIKTKEIITKLEQALNKFDKSKCPDKLRCYELTLTNDIYFIIEELKRVV